MTELKSINGKFFKYIIDFTPFQIKTFKVLCKNNKYPNLSHTFRLNNSKQKNKKKFVVFLTKSQIKGVNKAKKNKEKYDLEISNIQIGETCSSVIKLNDKIEKVTPKDIKVEKDYIKYIIYLTPSQIKSFGKRYIIRLNYKNLNNKKGFIVFLTNTQINKLEKSMANGEKVELKFSDRQFKLTNDFIKKENRKKLENLRLENQKKMDKIKASKQKLFFLKKGKINFDTFIKNTLKKYNEPKPKKKK